MKTKSYIFCLLPFVFAIAFVSSRYTYAKTHDYYHSFESSIKAGSSLPIGAFRNNGGDDTYHLGLDGGYWIQKDLRLSLEFSHHFNFFDATNTSLGITQGIFALDYSIITYKAVYTFMIGAGTFTSRMKLQSSAEPLITSTDPGLMSGIQIRFPEIASSFDMAFYSRVYLIPDERYHRLFLSFGISAIHRFGA